MSAPSQISPVPSYDVERLHEAIGFADRLTQEACQEIEALSLMVAAQIDPEQHRSAVEPLEPARVREPLAQRPELAAIPMQVRKLRVSRQMELQQHRLPTAAQEQLPYLPALPMKAPCWGVPAW